MNFESKLRDELAARADTFRTRPDGGDLARRIRRVQRSAQRLRHVTLAAALVVIAGSFGAVVGAFATRGPGGSQKINETPAKSIVPPTTIAPVGRSTTTTTAPPTSTAPTTVPTTSVPAGGTGGTGVTGVTGGTGSGPGQPGGRGVPAQHATLAGVRVDWLVTPLASPVTVVSGPGESATCLPASVVTVSVGGNSPVGGGSGVLGLPALAPAGLAVVSSGEFGSPGRPGGWWAIVETGSASSAVAVQFPSGAIVRAPVHDGLAVLAALAPLSDAGNVFSPYASAAASSGSGLTSSLQFVVGGAPTAVDALGPAVASSTTSTHTPTACLSARAFGLLPSGSGGRNSHTVTPGGGGEATVGGGPLAPETSAGEVVGAFEQAYNFDPLLGLDWNFAAISQSPSAGCSRAALNSLGGHSPVGSYRLSTPSLTVDAVAFVSAERAVVIYQRGAALRETGTAVLSGGSWKVSGATFCGDMTASGR